MRSPLKLGHLLLLMFQIPHQHCYVLPPKFGHHYELHHLFIGKWSIQMSGEEIIILSLLNKQDTINNKSLLNLPIANVEQ